MYKEDKIYTNVICDLCKEENLKHYKSIEIVNKEYVEPIIIRYDICCGCLEQISHFLKDIGWDEWMNIYEKIGRTVMSLLLLLAFIFIMAFIIFIINYILNTFRLYFVIPFIICLIVGIFIIIWMNLDNFIDSDS